MLLQPMTRIYASSTVIDAEQNVRTLWIDIFYHLGNDGHLVQVEVHVSRAF
jgi:hypothetical protein